MNDLVFITVPVYFESEDSYQQKELGIDKEYSVEDYDIVGIKLFGLPSGYYVRDFHGRPLVTLIVNDKDYITSLTEEEFLEILSKCFLEEETLENDNNI